MNQEIARQIGTGESRTIETMTLASIADLFAKLLAILKPPVEEDQSQRMCPFCGRITSRHETSCLECGKSLKPA